MKSGFELNIRLHLREVFTVENLAEHVGISQNHLNRLFRSALNSTVTEYIRMRRVQRAEHLLKYSNMPLKVIAADTGLGDPQHFSHVIRHVLGKTPLELRHREQHSERKYSK